MVNYINKKTYYTNKMVLSSLDTKGLISKIPEFEHKRYIDFFDLSYQENLAYALFVIDEFPRWSIISDYYAMHDISKLLLADIYSIKIEQEIHATTIKCIKELELDPFIQELIEKGYKQFKNFANDLAEGKKERVKTQYYTGTPYMKKKYKKDAHDFIKNIVQPYIEKITLLRETL